jgi:GAF domain-containing protein
MALLPKDGRDSALSWVVESARDEFNAERVEIWLWDADAALLRLVAALSADETVDLRDDGAEQTVRPGEGMLGKIVEERVALIDFEPVRITQDAAPARAPANGDDTEVYFAGYPLNFRNDFIGVMACYTRQPVQRDKQASWWVLGNSASIALHDSLLLRQRDQTIAALSALVTESHHFEPERALARLVGELSALTQQELGCPQASVKLADCARGELTVCSGERVERRPMATSVAGQAAASGEEIIRDAGSRGSVAVLAIPVRDTNGAVIAVLEASQSASFSERQQQTARSLTTMIGVALESARAALDAS